MKKTFLLLIAILATTTCANAVNWQPIDTDIPNFSLYIDTDTINNMTSDKSIYYAIKYQSGFNPEQVAYVKSTIKNNYIGIINNGDYNINTYKPKAVFTNAHVFMKPVNGDSFLNFAHNYVVNTVTEQLAVQNQKAKVANNDDSNIKNISYEIKKVPQKPTSATTLKEYVSEAAKLINANWVPPKSGKNTQAILIVQIGNDGSLQNYKFAKSTGNEEADRAIISAIEQTVPYNKFPKVDENEDGLNFQFVFNQKLFKKSVM